MSYLDPPPLPAAVIVTKDVGGYVDQYRAATELYRAQDREVRLHECRSACTLALSLPNVCVYPDSAVKFHAAYDPRNKAINWDETQKLFSTYPAPVQARLGALTREYKILSGAELISLGVRDCNEKRILVAKAAPVPESGDKIAKIIQGMKSALLTGSGTTGESGSPHAPASTPTPSAPALPVKTQAVTSPQSTGEPAPADVPLPPARPEEPEATAPAADVPLPPRRPTSVILAQARIASIPPAHRPMPGSSRILPDRFTPYAYVIVRR
ncbi:MAG: hypothetical protein QOF41_2597 [Methylobacteriaceae bacterium]|nr:hypothetical protein [Methylobacteriaceae bacterium]